MSKLKMVALVLAGLVMFDSENPISFNAVVSATTSTKFVANYPGSRFLDAGNSIFSVTLPGISLLNCGIVCSASTLTCAYFQFTLDTTTGQYGTCQMGNNWTAMKTASTSANQVGKDNNCFIFERTSTITSTRPTSTPVNVQTTLTPLQVQSIPISPSNQPTTTSTTSTVSTVQTTTSVMASTSTSTAATTAVTTSVNFSLMSKANSTNNPVNQSICDPIQSTTTWNCNCTTKTFCQGVLQCQIIIANTPMYIYLDTTSAAMNRFSANNQCDSLGMNMIMTKSLEALNVVCQVLYYAVGTEATASYWMGMSKSENTSAVWLYDDGTEMEQTMIDLINNDTSTGGNGGGGGRNNGGGGGGHNRHGRSTNRNRHHHDHGDDTDDDDECVIIAGAGLNFFLEISNCSVTGYPGSQNSPYLYFCEQ